MGEGYRMAVLVKQVPDTSSKAGVNPDGTVDRARAKRMMNPFDKFALQKALEARRAHGGEVIAISMGPPPAIETLVESLEYGADRGYLLSDKRLGASDTLATAYALYKTIRYLSRELGEIDIVFTGLQTTDGDTAQTGPQIAERLDWPQVTYLEKLKLDGPNAQAERIIEGGHQELSLTTPLLITVANSATKLGHKRFTDVYRVKELVRDEAEYAKRIVQINLDTIGADPKRAGLLGSPTVVGKTWKMGEIGGSCQVFSGRGAEEETLAMVDALIAAKPEVEELFK